MRKQRDKAFADLDTDKNGAISKAEFDAGAKLPEVKPIDGSKALAVYDKNKDKDVSRDEYLSPVLAVFDRLDANKDGSISRDEFAKGHEQRIEKRVEIRKQRQEGAKEGKNTKRMHRGMGGMGGTRMIVMADTNKDGRITMAEAETFALQHFDQMDTNHDGQVTPEERRAARPTMIKRMQAPSAG